MTTAVVDAEVLSALGRLRRAGQLTLVTSDARLRRAATAIVAVVGPDG